MNFFPILFFFLFSLFSFLHIPWIVRFVSNHTKKKKKKKNGIVSKGNGKKLYLVMYVYDILWGGGRKGEILNLNRVTRVRPFRRKGLNLNYKSEDVKECFIVFLEEKGKYIREFVMRFLGFPYSVSYRVEEKVALER